MNKLPMIIGGLVVAGLIVWWVCCSEDKTKETPVETPVEVVTP